MKPILPFRQQRTDLTALANKRLMELVQDADALVSLADPMEVVER